MEKIPTIEEFKIEYFKGEREYDRDPGTMAVAFAKMHVEACCNAQRKEAEKLGWDDSTFEWFQEQYPLKNIK